MSVVLPAPFGPTIAVSALRDLDVDVPEDGLLAVGDREVGDLDRRWTAVGARSSSERAGDRVRVVPHHADVRALRRPGGPSRPRRGPPISTSKPRALTASSTASIVRGDTDDSTKIAGIRRDAIRSASRCTSFAPASEAVEIPEADHLEAVRAAEVPERVVGGDDHAHRRRHGLALPPHLGVEGVELLEVRCGARAIARGVGRVGRGERVAHLPHRALPELDVEPDVRVVRPPPAGMSDRGILSVTAGQPPLADPLEDVGHLRLEVETAVEDHVGALERRTSPSLAL